LAAIMLRSLRECALGQTPKIKTYRHARAVIEALFACIIVGQVEKGVRPLFVETRMVFGDIARNRITGSDPIFRLAL